MVPYQWPAGAFLGLSEASIASKGLALGVFGWGLSGLGEIRIVAAKSKLMWVLAGPRGMWEEQESRHGAEGTSKSLYATWPCRIRSTDHLKTLFSVVERLNGDATTTITGPHGVCADVDAATRDAAGGTNVISIESNGGPFLIIIQTQDGVQQGRKFIRMFGRDPLDVTPGRKSPFEELINAVKDTTAPFSRLEVLRSETNVLTNMSSEKVEDLDRQTKARWRTLVLSGLAAP